MVSRRKNFGERSKPAPHMGIGQQIAISGRAARSKVSPLTYALSKIKKPSKMADESFFRQIAGIINNKLSCQHYHA